MMQPGIQPLFSYPSKYKGFHLVRSHGRVYAIPGYLQPADIHDRNRLISHPATLSAANEEELAALINGCDTGRCQPEPVGSYQGYTLVRQGDFVYGVPQATGWVDFNLDEECRDTGVIRGQTLEDVQERIRAGLDNVPVEFAGWLPIYAVSGNCGRHPQFQHTADPPAGYRFTSSAPAKRRGRSIWNRSIRWLTKWVCRIALGLWMLLQPLVGVFFRGGWRVGPRARLRVLAVMMRLFFRLICNGARPVPVLRFLKTRHYQSQVLLANYRGLVFLTSMPYTYGQNPWVVEVEDPTTLFYPLIENGQTSQLELADSPYFPIVKTLLESDQCKGILTHMKSTARMIATLFDSPRVTAKVRYTPLGVALPQCWQRHDEAEPEHLNLVFINSWCQVPANFFARGGLDVLEAFAVLHERYPHLRLTLRTELPPLDPHYHRIIEAGWVRVIKRFLSSQEMEALLAEGHIFLLPSARVHIVSLLQAMAAGLAVVTSDGWGIDEYIDHNRNGLIVPGRYGKASWVDEKAGMLKENYEPMLIPDPAVVDGLVEAVSRLVEDPSLCKRLGRTARHDAQTIYTVERWNRGLKDALDMATEQGRGASGERREPKDDGPEASNEPSFLAPHPTSFVPQQKVG